MSDPETCQACGRRPAVVVVDGRPWASRCAPCDAREREVASRRRSIESKRLDGGGDAADYRYHGDHADDV